MNAKKQVSKAMREAADRRNISDSQLAKEIGCSKSAVYSWLTGVYIPRKSYDAAIERALGVDIGAICERYSHKRKGLRHKWGRRVKDNAGTYRRMCLRCGLAEVIGSPSYMGGARLWAPLGEDVRNQRPAWGQLAREDARVQGNGAVRQLLINERRSTYGLLVKATMLDSSRVKVEWRQHEGDSGLCCPSKTSLRMTLGRLQRGLLRRFGMDEMKQQVATMIRHFRAQNHPASLWLTNALDEMNKEVKPAWVANCPHCGVECEEFGHEYTAQMSATWGCVDGAVEVINTEELSDSGGYDHCFECGQTIQVNLLEWRAKG